MATVDYCYNIGLVCGTGYCGGLIGYNPSSKIQYSYNASEVQGGNAIVGISNYSHNTCYYDSSKATDTKGIPLDSQRMRDKSAFDKLDFDGIYDIKANVNEGRPYLRENDPLSAIGKPILSYSLIPFSNTGNDLEYPIFNETAFARQLQVWIGHNTSAEVFSAFLDQGYSYTDLLYMTVDIPVMSDDGTALSVKSSAQIKDVMAYIVFADAVQKYFSNTISEVRNKISQGKTEDAYSYFFDNLKNFYSQYLYFQDNLNGGDAFNQTLYSLLLAKTAMIYVDSLESYTYFTDMYKASVSESPQYYDDLYYYILSGGDTDYLNSYYSDVLKGYATVIKDTKKLVKIYKGGGIGDPASVIDLGFSNIDYFAKKYDWNCQKKVKEQKKIWEFANCGIDIVKAVSSGSVFGLMGAAYSLETKYIDKVKEVFEDAQTTEAGWYALAYYYFEKYNPDVLKAIVNPDTGAVTFSTNTINSMALYGVPYDSSDTIQKNLMRFFEKELWSKQNTYSPSTELKFYLWNAANVANNITDIDCNEYLEYMIDYIMAEINLENGNAGAYFEANVWSNDSALGTVVGNGTYLAGSYVTVQAILYESGSFVGWKNADNDSVISTDPNYSFVITSNLNVKAVFNEVGGQVVSAPVLVDGPQNATYYKGQQASALTVSAYSTNGDSLIIDWYRSSKDSNKSGTFVGSGETIIPTTEEKGTLYYYAVIRSESDLSYDSMNVKTNTARITVTDPVVIGMSVSSLPRRTTYILDEEFKTSGMTVVLDYSDGTNVNITDYNVTYDFSSVGTKTVQIEWLGFVQQIEVEVVTVVDGAFYTGATWQIDTITGVMTVEGEQEVPEFAFEDIYDYRKYVKELVIEDGITAVGYYAFRSMPSLTSITLPESLTRIDERAFYACKNLSIVNIPATVVEIGQRAFNPSYVTQIVGMNGTEAHRYATENEIPFNAIDGLKFFGASLTLQNNLKVNFIVDSELIDGYGYSNPYVVFTMNDKETIADDYRIVDGDYVFGFSNLSPDAMNDVIKAKLYASRNGTVFESEEVEYSIETYCYSMLDITTDVKLKTLLVDLLHYGAASQLYTGHNTDNLVDANLTEEQLAWGTNEVLELASALDTKYAEVDDQEVTWKAAALCLSDSITMQLYFLSEAPEGITVKIKNASGGVLATITDESFEKVSGRYRVSFKGLNAGQMSDVVYITAYRNNVAISNTVAYSIESYAFAKQNDADENLANLVKAMMKYGKSAYHYVH